MKLSQMRRWFGSVAAAVLVAACASDTAVAPPNFNEAPRGRAVTVYKFGPTGTTATFEITATGGELLRGSTVTLWACDPNTPCDTIRPVEVWRPTSDDTVIVTITEISATGNVILERIAVNSELDGHYNIVNPEDPHITIDIRADGSHGGGARFKNIPGPDDEPTAGCTPGFWKQRHHYEFWTAPYTPDTPFGSVFADAFPGLTLLDVVRQGGGGLNALGRHTVAALLNAASADVDYGMTAAGVISAFNAAYASGDFEGLKDVFEGRNELGCTAKD